MWCFMMKHHKNGDVFIIHHTKNMASAIPSLINQITFETSVLGVSDPITAPEQERGVHW